MMFAQKNCFYLILYFFSFSRFFFFLRYNGYKTNTQECKQTDRQIERIQAEILLLGRKWNRRTHRLIYNNNNKRNASVRPEAWGVKKCRSLRDI